VDRVFLHNTLQDSETLSSEVVPGGIQGNSSFVTSLYDIYVGGWGGGGGEDCALRKKSVQSGASLGGREWCACPRRRSTRKRKCFSKNFDFVQPKEL